MRFRAALFALGLLLPAAAAAAPSHQANLTAASAGWEQGHVTSGTFLALRRLAGTDQPGTFFSVEAGHLNVTKVKADEYAYVGVPGGPFVNVLPHRTYEDYDDVTLAASEGRAARFAYVVNLPGAPPAALRVSCGQQVGKADSVQIPNQVEIARPNAPVDTSQALQFGLCSGQEVSVCGSFQLALWEWDALGSSRQGDLRLESGQLPLDGAPDTRPTLGRAQQLYLAVTDGCFTMQDDASEPAQVFVQDFSLEASTLQLASVAGTLADVGPLAGQTVQLSGQMSVTLKRTTDAARPVSAVASGVDVVTVDGQQVLSTATNQAVMPLWAWIVGLGLVGAVLVPPAVLVGRRPLRPRRMAAVAEQAWNALEARDGVTAEARARKLLHWKPHSATANFLLGSALRLQGRYSEAVAAHDKARAVEADWSSPDLPAWNLALGALSMVRHLHDGGPAYPREKVVAWLRDAVQHQPAMQTELAAHRELDELLSEVSRVP